MLAAFRQKPHLLISVLLVILSLTAFWPALDNEFINFDDAQYVTENPHVLGGLSTDSIKWAFTSSYASNWHPLTWLSHMLDYEIYGLNPAGHHLSGVLLHVLSGVALFLILSLTTGAPWKSAFVAAVFAVHPLRVESVAWVAERKDVLSGLFWMLTTLSYLHYAKKPRSSRYVLVAALFALGLMAKPMLVTLPLALLLLDYWPLKRLNRLRDVRGLVVEKLPLLAMVIASCIVTVWAQHKGGSVVDLETFSVGVRAANAILAYTVYVGKLVVPINLTVFYPHPGPTLPLWKPLTAAVLFMSISAAIVVAGRSRRYLLTGWLWYVITLLPVIGLVQVGGQAVADRYTYLPVIGLLIIIAWGFPEILRTFRPQLRAGVPLAFAAVLLSAMTMNTRSQAEYWRDSVTLFEHAVSCTGPNYLARANLADALARKGRLDEAITQSEKALSIAPRNPEAHCNLGGLLSNAGHTQRAIEKFYDALRIDPDYADAHYNLGTTLASQGKMGEAINHYRRALRIEPTHAQSHANLGNALSEMGRLEEAEIHLSRALQLRPDIPDNYNNRGVNLARLGRPDEAVVLYRCAIAAKPSHVGAHVNLGEALAEKGKVDAAAKEYAFALELDSTSAEAHNGLGKICVVRGALSDAQVHYREAIRLKPEFADAHANLGVSLAMDGRLDEALKCLKTAVTLMPSHADAHANLAVAYFRLGRLPEAWREVHASRRYGGEPNPKFIAELAGRMPDPYR